MGNLEEELGKVSYEEELVVGKVRAVEREHQEMEEENNYEKYKVINGKKRRYEFVFEKFGITDSLNNHR